MLGAISAHLNPSLRVATAAEAGTIGCRDLYGNAWRAAGAESVVVEPAGDAAEKELVAPGRGEPLVAMAADHAGFVWAATSSSLHRLCPKAVGTSGASPAGPQAWQDCAPLPPGTIASIAAAEHSDSLLRLTMADGSHHLVDAPQHDSGAIVVSAGEEQASAWELLPVRRPCPHPPPALRRPSPASVATRVVACQSSACVPAPASVPTHAAASPG